MGKTKRAYNPEQIVAAADDSLIAAIDRLRADPALFAEHVCGLKPHRKQAEFLRLDWTKNIRSMLAWNRQAGKSVITACLITWLTFAHSNFSAFIFSPSGEQSRAIMDHIVRWYETAPLLSQLGARLKHDKLSVGGSKWGSSVELVRVGLTGDLGRGRSTKGFGLCVWDEFNSFTYPQSILGTLSPITASGGSQIILSSPGDPGSPMHRLYEDWQQLGQDDDRYAVIDCDWRDTNHLTAEWVEDERRKYESLGAAWQFEREILGRWVAPSNTWFAHDDLQRCILPTIDKGRPGDVYVWSCDPGGRGKASAFVICIARLNQIDDRLEVVDLRSFKFENHKYRNDSLGGGSETIHEYEQVIDICCDLRHRYPPAWFGIDPNTERSLAEQLEKLHFPISEICVGGYAAKLTFLEDLRRCVAERRIVWSDDRITRQLQGYCPRRDENTGRWTFPEANADIVICMGQLYRYLGERIIEPFAVECVEREVAALW